MVVKLFRTGFTLIELILVLLLLSVFLGLAAPNFRNSFGGIELKTTARHLVDVMRYAQSEAVTTGQTVKLKFNPEFSNYWLARVDPADSDKDEKIKTPVGEIFNFPADFNITVSRPEINFYSDSTMDKEELSLCRKERCFIISTKEQRGKILLYDNK